MHDYIGIYIIAASACVSLLLTFLRSGMGGLDSKYIESKTPSVQLSKSDYKRFKAQGKRSSVKDVSLSGNNFCSMLLLGARLLSDEGFHICDDDDQKNAENSF